MNSEEKKKIIEGIEERLKGLRQALEQAYLDCNDEDIERIEAVIVEKKQFLQKLEND